MRGRKVISLLAASTLAWGAFLPLATQVVEARAETSALAMSWETPIGEGATLQRFTKSFADQQISILVTKVDMN
ncbi:hypothetical protein MXD63_45425, partial [Frankia sp. Cpl3]|nr:hypothetical protein [Frankia sp. Cpl3]